MTPSPPRDSELARIDERTALMLEELRELKRNMVTRAEFNPVRAIAFGLVAVAMLALLGAMIAQVLRNTREISKETATPTPAISASAAPGTVTNSPLLLAAHLPLGVGRPKSRRSSAARALLGARHRLRILALRTPELPPDPTPNPPRPPESSTGS